VFVRGIIRVNKQLSRRQLASLANSCQPQQQLLTGRARRWRLKIPVRCQAAIPFIKMAIGLGHINPLKLTVAVWVVLSARVPGCQKLQMTA